MNDDDRPSPERSPFVPLSRGPIPATSDTMLPLDVLYLPEEPAHDAEIEAINAEAFGPGRFTKAAYKIREGGPHDRALSFVATKSEAIVASVRLTPVAVGGGRALLLGPLAVRPAHKNLGIGRKLVAIALKAAADRGHEAVILVGDEPYYGPLGFQVIPKGQVAMPRPVDPRRLLVHEIEPGSVASLRGEMKHADLAASGAVASRAKAT